MPPAPRPGQALETRLPLSASSAVAVLSTAAAGALSSFATSPSSRPGPVLSVTATDPAQGARITTPLTALTVTFDRPVAAFTLGTLDVLVEGQQGGSWASLFSASNAPAEGLDATGTRLTLNLSQPLAPGDYRLVLPELSNLFGADGSIAADLGHDQVLAAFTVDRPGVTLADAVDIPGSPASTTVSVSGALDLQNNPGAVDLYKFALPAGHRWRLGAEVQAGRLGSPLDSTLSLFDAAGRLIDTANVGRPDVPGDPYLFAGLTPGTYYLGVSAHDNVPGTPGGYAPATGRAASNLPTQTGGAYRLDVVADPADAPTRVLGSSLQYADPLDPHPTGLALAFSGPLDASGLRGIPSGGVSVVDQDGRSFPLTAVGENESAAQYYFLFNEDVPAGHYSVVVPDAARGGLTDLAGLTPVAPGRPAGVLATFVVGGNIDHSPSDLGPLYLDVHAGITRKDVIAPGGGVTYRFVVTAEGKFELTTRSTGGSLTAQALVGGRPVGLDTGKTGQTVGNDLYLKPGVYYVQFANRGAGKTTLTWTLSESTSWDSLLNNGVGQGPALNLRLINPTSSGLTDTPAPATGGPTPAVTTVTTPGVPNGAPAAPGGVLFTLGNTLVGRPSTQPEHVGAVGPSTAPGSPALASSGSG
ncbi:MAG: DVUA0089 family protein, partial [Planctomycetia bacterium]|nr:DVUA0089 family protein [Planctomycetia bacterium]